MPSFTPSTNTLHSLSGMDAPDNDKLDGLDTKGLTKDELDDIAVRMNFKNINDFYDFYNKRKADGNLEKNYEDTGYTITTMFDDYADRYINEIKNYINNKPYDKQFVKEWEEKAKKANLKNDLDSLDSAIEELKNDNPNELSEIFKRNKYIRQSYAMAY